MATLIVRSKNELIFYVANLVSLIVLFALFISFLGLLDFFNLYSYIDFSNNSIASGNTSVDSPSVDYNFALLPVFFGIISIFYFLLKKASKLNIILLNILLLVFSIDIVLSGSRRGLFTFITILVLLFIAQIFSFYKKDTFFKKLGKNSRYFLLSFLLLTILSSYIVCKTNNAFKIKVLELIGSKNLTETKQKIALHMFKYTLIFRNHNSFLGFYFRMWPTIPEDPDTGWGTRVHKTIFPLTGKNVEIVPGGIKGYLMDSTCNVSYYSKINLSESFTYTACLNVSKGDSYKASVYCFVSDSFDVNTVCFGVESRCISKHIVSGKVITLYNIESKGTWQKLEVEFDCNDGEVPLSMSFWKSGIKDFSKIKGYVIFAYPTYEKINKTDNILPSRSTKCKVERVPFIKPELELNASHNIYNKSLTFSKKNIEITEPGIINRSRLYSHTRMSISEHSSSIQKYFYSGIFYLPLSVFFASGSIQNDQDPIRKLASKFISEDSTYYPYRANIIADTISNSFSGPRIARWSFAVKIYTKEYSWSKKIFGSGFNFLNWYGYVFYGDKKRSDYPHNPFLSVLLYSGIIGLLIYLIFMYKVFYYYIKYFKEYKILSVFFIITFFFSFFSAGSPFDPPMMGFFVILPFFIHSIHEREKNHLKLINMNDGKID
jgi:hypothetical protein